MQALMWAALHHGRALQGCCVSRGGSDCWGVPSPQQTQGHPSMQGEQKLLSLESSAWLRLTSSYNWKTDFPHTEIKVWRS